MAYTGPFPHTNAGTITAIIISHTAFSGNIGNTGTISPNGITLTDSTINGSIYNSTGTIAGGITLDSTSEIVAADNGIGDDYGIQIEGSGSFTGGINNAGTILSTAEVGGGITVNNAKFLGGITNSGTISSGNTAINASVFNGTFQGGITNSGKIVSTSKAGIAVSFAAVFGTSGLNGGITNTGTISALNAGISANFTETITSFAGGISNQGTITAGGAGIFLGASTFNSLRSGFISAFSGGITNSGKIVATTSNGIGIHVGGHVNPSTIVAAIGISSFGGGIVNSGTISSARDGIVVAGQAFTGQSGTSSTFTISTFGGGIVNSSTISAAGKGIYVGGTATGVSTSIIHTFSGGITNTGLVTAHTGILINSHLVNFTNGAIFNSGTIIGSGGTAVNISQFSGGITFELGPGYSISGNVVGNGSDTFALGGSGSGAFDLSTIGASDQYRGFDAFDVESGTWTVSNTFGQAQTWTVAGGTLAGTGTLKGVSVSSGATLEPGTPGSAGTELDISGTLTFASGAGYLDTIAGANASETSITGTATLGGATVTVAAGSTVETNTKYTILADTGGGIGGSNTFSGSVTYGGLVGTLSYDADHAYLEFSGPSLTAAATATFTQGGAVTLSPSVTVSDPASTSLASATVSVTGDTFAGDGDVLATSTSGTSITASYDSSTETLTLTGSDTLADYQTVLERVTFNSTTLNPTDYGSDPTRLAEWVVNDGAATSTTATTTVSITNVNDPPTLGNVATGAHFTQGAGAVTLSNAVTVTDPDNLSLASATVSITSGTFANDGDALAATTAGTSITASYNSSTETLTLSGSDTLAHYQSVLDSISFNSTSLNPTDYGSQTSRQVTWVLNDGSGSNNLSAAATTTVTITAVNQAPTLSNVATSVHFTEDGGGVSVNNGFVIGVTDPDDLDLSSATVSVIAGTFAGDGDVLAATTAGTSITASYNSSTETLMLSGTDTLADYAQVLNSVTFNDTSQNPTDYGSAGNRQIGWVVMDPSGTANGGQNINSPEATTTVSITAVNDPPTLGNVATGAHFTQGAGAVTLSNAVSVTDPDNLDLASATAHVASGTFAGDGDVLAATTAGTSITASYNSSTETLTLSGSDTLAHYQSVLDSISFNSTSLNPTDYGSQTSRQVTWVLNDGSGSNNLSAAATTTVTITAVNQAPTLSNVATSVHFTEDGGGVSVNNGFVIGVTDPDDLDLSSATVSVIAGTFAGDGDVLAATTAGTSITASYNSSTETLMLSGTDTLADYAQVLNSVTFNDTSQNPTDYGSAGNRQIGWVVMDPSGTANGGQNINSPEATTTVSITAVNDPPTLGNVATGAAFTVGQPAVTLSGSVSVSDPDNLDLAGATISVTGGTFAGDGDVLAATTAGTSITASYNSSTETLTLSGSDTLAHYQAVLDTVTFNSTGADPTDGGADPTRTVSWMLNDGGTSNNLSTAVTETVSIFAGPVLTAAASVNFTEGGTAVTLSGAAALSDVGSTTLASATVALTSTDLSNGTFAPFGQSTGDVLAFNTSGTSITASYNSTTETLTLTGTDTLAHYQQVLDSITFNSTSQNPTDYGSDPARTATWTVNDGRASNNTGTATETINLTAVNNPPTLSGVPESASFTQNGGAASLSPSFSAITLSDPDNLDMAGATVSITGGTFASDGDVLATNTTGTAVTESYNSSTETLVLSGIDTLADYRAILSLVTFNSTSQNPTDYGSDPTRTVTWQVNDGGSSNNLSNVEATTVSITAVNNPPTLSNVATSANYTQGGAAVTLSGAVTVSDPDNLDLASATVSISGGTFANDGDVLAASTAGTSITASYNSSTETLTLTGSDTLAHYQQVLDTVTFSDPGSLNPTNYGSDPTRTVTWTVNDGASSHSSASATSTIDVVNVNDPPTLGNVATSDSFTQNGGAVSLAPGASVTDPDDLTLVSATVSIAGGTFAGDGDVLTTDVTGLAITASYNSTTETLTLTGTDTLADYQHALDSVAFSSTSQNPTDYGSDPTRTVTWVLKDPGGTANGGQDTSALSTTTVSITAVNNPPTLSNVATSQSFTEEGGAVTLSGAVAVSDPDNLDLASATVRITGGTFANDGDVLAATTAGTAILASYNSTTETLTLSGSDTLAHYRGVLDTVTFNAGENPNDFGSNPSRQVTWVLNDGSASNNLSTAVTSTVGITNVNDPPTLASVATSAHFTQGAGATTLASALSVADPDDLDLKDATVAITGGTFANDGDVLAATITGTAILASYNSSTETLTLSGTDTLAHYQQVLDSITFNDTSLNPTQYGSALTRTVTWVVQDPSGTLNGGMDTSTVATTTVSVTNVNDPPTLGNVATSQSFTEAGGAVTLSGAVAVSDPDNLSLAGATVKITGGTFAGDGDVLAATTTGTAISASYNSTTETLTLSGSDTLAHYQGVLDTVTFNAGQNPTDFGSDPTRTVTWVLNDGGASNNLSTAVTTTVSVTNLSHPPTLGNVATSQQFTEAAGAVTLSGAVSVTDPDNLTLASATVSITGGTFANDADMLAANTTGTSITASYNSSTETLTLSGADTLAHYQGVLDTVTFNDTSLNPTDYGSNPTRQVSWVLNNGSASNNLSTAVTTTVSVTGVNNPPVFTLLATSVNISGANAITPASAVRVNDPDDLTLASATVAITGGTFAGDGDVLTANISGTGITASYNAATETLTLTGADTPAHYTQVLESIRFQSTAADPTNGGADPTRTLTWTAQDPHGATTSATETLTFAPNPPPPAGTTEVMIMERGSTGTYEIYDLGNNAFLGAQELGQIGTNLQALELGAFNGSDLYDMLMRDQSNGEFWMDDISGNTITRVTDMGNVGLSWQVLGFGNFSGNAGETDMLMRDTSTGNLELYDIANGQFTGFHNMQNIGTSWQVLGFGDFSGNAGESDMLMRDSATGNLELYDITQNGYTGFHNMQNIGTSWQVLGFGDFSGNAGESDMLMRDSATGNLELYDITNNQYTGFHNMQNIGTSWQVLGFGDFSGNVGESDMLMRDSATGNVELYDINHNQYTGFFALGNIALAWSVVAFGDFSGNAGEADMLMRNTNTGEFELYDITNNTITNKIDLGNVGPEWAAIGVADPPAPGQSTSTSQLTQAMAAFAPASSAPLATAAPPDPTTTPAGAANPLGTPMPTPRLGA